MGVHSCISRCSMRILALQAYKTVASKLGYGLTFIYGIDSADLLVRRTSRPTSCCLVA